MRNKFRNYFPFIALEAQFSLAQEDFTTLDQRLCAAFDHLFLPDNWTITGNSDENVKNQLDNRETLLHFAARLGLEKTILLLMTKARSRYAINIMLDI